MKKVVGAIVALVILLTFLSFSHSSLTPVFANANEVGEITATSLNVREQPNTSSRIIGSLSRGTSVELHEKTGQWYKIRLNNRWGYIHGDYVKVVKSASANSGSIIGKGEVTATRLNVRDQASTNGRIVGSLNRGAKIDLYEKVGQWYKIKVNNNWAFVHGDYLKVTGTSSNSGSGSLSGNVIGNGEITASRLNVRDKASTSGKIIGTLVNGTKVEFYEKTGAWYRIRVNNSWGYIHGDYLKVSSGSSGTGTGSNPGSSTSQIIGNGEITASRLNIRDQANTNGRIIGSLERGKIVELHEKAGQWFKIKSGNGWGYIHGDYVKVTNSGNGSSNSIVGVGQVTANSLNIRAQTSTSSAIVGSLSRNTQVDLYEKVGDWYKIKVNSGWGYIHGSYVNVTSAGSGSSGGSSSSGGISGIDLTGKTIFLDPGHGGRDPGAIVNGVYESHIAMDISNQLKGKLESTGAKVVMSRTNDTFVSLSNRVTLANNSGADIFISIHMNFFSSTSASGVEMFYDRTYQGNNSHKLANALQQQMVQQMGLRDRGIKERGLEVVKYTRMPAVLAELGFMSNPNDLSMLLNQQDQITDALVHAIDLYFK
ncbi:SH3 domain-containing protein [Evansella tamaricis]|uniref:SH3 domain-containing protein n=1 Tax=Evansella tamaricis TaxID=2069301 RepID=A0ABS6JIM1_9BACI|nr:SH3 domain-containing protein [Evansella tamaricis]MBU9713519.1 SH3 domain-containing protein [Evansella tamaricis]